MEWIAALMGITIMFTILAILNLFTSGLPLFLSIAADLIVGTLVVSFIWWVSYGGKD